MAIACRVGEGGGVLLLFAVLLWYAVTRCCGRDEDSRNVGLGHLSFSAASAAWTLSLQGS